MYIFVPIGEVVNGTLEPEASIDEEGMLVPANLTLGLTVTMEGETEISLLLTTILSFLPCPSLLYA
jgi:hypothetical protein